MLLTATELLPSASSCLRKSLASSLSAGCRDTGMGGCTSDDLTWGALEEGDASYRSGNTEEGMIIIISLKPL